METNKNKELGRRLKEILKVTMHSKDDLKNLLAYNGSGYAQINNLLSGQHGLRKKQLEKISTEWNIRIEYLEGKDEFITEDDLYFYKWKIAHNEFLISTTFLELIGLEVEPVFYLETTISAAYKCYKETSSHLSKDDKEKLDSILVDYKKDLAESSANKKLVKALKEHKYFELVEYICNNVKLQSDVNARYNSILDLEKDARKTFGDDNINYINDNGFGFVRGYKHCLRYLNEGNHKVYENPNKLLNLLNETVNNHFGKNKGRVLFFILESLPEWVISLNENSLKHIAYGFSITKSFNNKQGEDTCLVKIGFLVKNGTNQVLLSFDNYFEFLDIIIGNARSLKDRIYDNNVLRNMSYIYNYIDYKLL